MSNTSMNNVDDDWAVKSLDDFELYGWKADPTISWDDNVMDLVLLVTRSSTCKQGHMACILVKPSSDETMSAEDDLSQAIRDSIISVATNMSLYKEKSSDVHAEVCALGSAARVGRKTEGCSAFITMPPCRGCFGALVAAGVKRIVTRLKCLLPEMLGAAETMGIELVILGKITEQNARINTLIYGDPNGKRRDPQQTKDRPDAKRHK